MRSIAVLAEQCKCVAAAAVLAFVSQTVQGMALQLHVKMGLVVHASATAPDAARKLYRVWHYSYGNLLSH
jgi:hypothetical protein